MNAFQEWKKYKMEEWNQKGEIGNQTSGSNNYKCVLHIVWCCKV